MLRVIEINLIVISLINCPNYEVVSMLETIVARKVNSTYKTNRFLLDSSLKFICIIVVARFLTIFNKFSSKTRSI